MKQLQYILGAIIFFVVGVFVGWGIPRAPISVPRVNTETQIEASRQVGIMFDEGDGTVKTFENRSFNEGESLFDFTKRIAEVEGMNFSFERSGEFVFVTEINGKRSGTDGKYWLVWVNNHMSEVSANQYQLRPGDVIEWKFINLRF